ncbi:hypothetical protein [Bacillus sp. T33-2]|uniref:hypothetical protein n=1 Tax=Bacillus sp. T33-2 TaxID=2054168 RepID=UPI0011571783|nr:hypothetical protein [Bacillus sp. T33-2]
MHWYLESKVCPSRRQCWTKSPGNKQKLSIKKAMMDKIAREQAKIVHQNGNDGQNPPGTSKVCPSRRQ